MKRGKNGRASLPPAFLRPLVHGVCACRNSCLDCVNRGGPDESCHLRDEQGYMVAACWWRWNGEWPTKEKSNE